MPSGAVVCIKALKKQFLSSGLSLGCFFVLAALLTIWYSGFNPYKNLVFKFYITPVYSAILNYELEKQPNKSITFKNFLTLFKSVTDKINFESSYKKLPCRSKRYVFISSFSSIFEDKILLSY